MPEARVNHYEGMFLLSQTATADLAAAVDHLKAILDKVGAELIAMSRWDERRLAYEIKKQKRGLFILTYFTCPARHLADLERECNLSEVVLRELIIRADHLTEEEMRAADAQEELLTEAALRRERDAAREEARDGEQAEQRESEPVAAEQDRG